MNSIEFLRAFVRPYLELILGSAMVGLAIYLTIKFADPDLAKYIVTAVVTAGISLFSYYFGERAGKAKGDK